MIYGSICTADFQAHRTIECVAARYSGKVDNTLLGNLHSKSVLIRHLHGIVKEGTLVYLKGINAMFLRLSITVLSLLVLASCARNPKNITDYDLCYKLATLPSFNINTDAREAEVRSRNLNCRVYASRIDEQKRALELEKAGATKISNTTTVQQPIKWKNESIICNTVGTQTYCN